MLSARIADEDKARIENAAAQLRVDLSSFVVQSAKVASEGVLSDRWECRRIWFDGAEILMVGEGRGPAGADCVDIVAPRRFFETLQLALRR